MIHIRSLVRFSIIFVIFGLISSIRLRMWWLDGIEPDGRTRTGARGLRFSIRLIESKSKWLIGAYLWCRISGARPESPNCRFRYSFAFVCSTTAYRSQRRRSARKAPERWCPPGSCWFWTGRGARPARVKRRERKRDRYMKMRLKIEPDKTDLPVEVSPVLQYSSGSPG